MYLKKTVNTPFAIFVYKYNSWRYGRKATRGPNGEKTNDRQKLINKRIARHKRIWTICDNFDKQDYYITLTYRMKDRPDSIDEAMKIISYELGKVSRILKSKEKKLKYFHICERGQKGAVHHHLLIKNNFSISDLELRRDGKKRKLNLWSYGKMMVEKVYSYDVIKLAKYFVKGDSEESEKRYSQSRDVICPEPKIEIIKAEKWRVIPEAKIGYDILEVQEGIDGMYGKGYQEYIQVRRE